MEKMSQIKLLRENKLLRTNEEIANFENALENILSYNDYKDIEFLCTGFDDNTDDHEVMFSLIHAIDSYDKFVDIELNLKAFLNSVLVIYPYAKEWLIIMNVRILNNQETLEHYIKVVKTCDKELKNLLIQLINEIKNENPKQFAVTADKFISSI